MGQIQKANTLVIENHMKINIQLLRPNKSKPLALDNTRKGKNRERAPFGKDRLSEGYFVANGA